MDFIFPSAFFFTFFYKLQLFSPEKKEVFNGVGEITFRPGTGTCFDNHVFLV